MLPGGTTLAKVNASLTKWLTGKCWRLIYAPICLILFSHFTGPKSPGLIILEHELSAQSVTAFMDAYPVMQANGWNITSTAELAGNLPYQNADSSTAPVTPANGVIVGDINSSEAPSTSTATSASLLIFD